MVKQGVISFVSYRDTNPGHKALSLWKSNVMSCNYLSKATTYPNGISVYTTVLKFQLRVDTKAQSTLASLVFICNTKLKQGVFHTVYKR